MYIGMQICLKPVTGSSAAPNIPEASQPLPTSHCQIKHMRPLGGCAPRRRRAGTEEKQPRPALPGPPLPGWRRSPGLCEMPVTGSASPRFANLFWGINGCSERFPPLCINVISHATQNAPGTCSQKRALTWAPSMNGPLCPAVGQPAKTTSCPSGSPPTRSVSQSRTEPTVSRTPSYPC